MASKLAVLAASEGPSSFWLEVPCQGVEVLVDDDCRLGAEEQCEEQLSVASGTSEASVGLGRLGSAGIVTLSSSTDLGGAWGPKGVIVLVHDESVTGCGGLCGASSRSTVGR